MTKKDKFVLLTVSQQPGQEPRIVNIDVIEVPRGSRFLTVTIGAETKQV